MDGLLILDKPAGMTSHDVVNVVRRLAGTRKVGHAGTLDPLATGVLVVLVGAATRLARFLDHADKTYRAVARLGSSTTTYDAAGDITEEHPVTVTRATVEAALAHFRGPIFQIPPMYSALKVDGKTLYKLARQGREIEREARPVTIQQLTLTDWRPPELTLEVTCSAGTYVRSLVHDLGQRLGCGAHLRALTRTASGRFRLEDSYSLDTLRALTADGRLAEALLPPQTALGNLPTLYLTIEQVQAVRYGRAIAPEVAPDAAEAQALDAEETLIAVLRRGEAGEWQPDIVLNGAN